MEHHSPGRVGPLQVLRGFRSELRATLAVGRRATVWFWIGLGFVFAVAALAGMLPLGRISVYIQCISLGLFGLALIQPETLALEFRADEDAELSGREDSDMVAYLPTLLVLAAFPFYVVGQAVLFQRVMLHYPGILEGSGWGDAWRISLNNLLYTEILFDAVDVFRLGLVPDPEHRVGQAMVFVTRSLLSLAFIRILLQMGRAAYFRAHGMGRGVDHGKALAGAVADRDLPGIRYAAEGLVEGISDAVRRLAGRAAAPGGDLTARRSLHGLRDWAAPRLEHMTSEPSRVPPHLASRLEQLMDLRQELEAGTPPAPPASTPWRIWRCLLPPALLGALLFTLSASGGAPALILGLLAFSVLSWLLVTPQSSLERARLLGILPSFPARHLVRWTLVWAALLQGAEWAGGVGRHGRMIHADGRLVNRARPEAGARGGVHRTVRVRAGRWRSSLGEHERDGPSSTSRSPLSAEFRASVRGGCHELDIRPGQKIETSAIGSRIELVPVEPIARFRGRFPGFPPIEHEPDRELGASSTPRAGSSIWPADRTPTCLARRGMTWACSGRVRAEQRPGPPAAIASAPHAAIVNCARMRGSDAHCSVDRA